MCPNGGIAGRLATERRHRATDAALWLGGDAGGQWLRLRPPQRVLAERWQVTQVQARSLTLKALAAEPDCPASQGDISLMIDNKDGKP